MKWPVDCTLSNIYDNINLIYTHTKVTGSLQILRIAKRRSYGSLQCIVINSEKTPCQTGTDIINDFIF